MKKSIKCVFIIPFYLFLAFAGFIGGGAEPKDIWDKLVMWVNK